MGAQTAGVGGIKQYGRGKNNTTVCTEYEGMNCCTIRKYKKTILRK